jgi:hypothetical protein
MHFVRSFGSEHVKQSVWHTKQFNGETPALESAWVKIHTQLFAGAPAYVTVGLAQVLHAVRSFVAVQVSQSTWHD